MAHSPKKLIQTTSESAAYLYDYIADHYWEMTKDELKEVLLATLGVCLDKCCGEDDEKALGQLLVEELGNRYYGED